MRRLASSSPTALAARSTRASVGRDEPQKTQTDRSVGTELTLGPAPGSLGASVGTGGVVSGDGGCRRGQSRSPGRRAPRSRPSRLPRGCPRTPRTRATRRAGRHAPPRRAPTGGPRREAGAARGAGGRTRAPRPTRPPRPGGRRRWPGPARDRPYAPGLLHAPDLLHAPCPTPRAGPAPRAGAVSLAPSAAGRSGIAHCSHREPENQSPLDGCVEEIVTLRGTTIRNVSPRSGAGSTPRRRIELVRGRPGPGALDGGLM